MKAQKATTTDVIVYQSFPHEVQIVHFYEKFKVENVDFFLKFQRVTKSTQSSIDFIHFAGNSI